MKVILKHVGVRSTDAVDSMIEERLLTLRERQVIEEAHVTLERRHDRSPAFGVRIHMVIPGKDLRVEAADQTLLAAALKASRELERVVTRRQHGRRRRLGRNVGSAALVRGWA